MTDASYTQMANALRALSMDAVEKAQSGHPGMPLGMADVATVLFRDFLKFNPDAPLWPDRDRFILSAGHGSMLLYALSYLTGYSHMTLDELKNFRQWNSYTPGHPERHPIVGVETTTGPLGQGIANAVGCALAESILQAQFGAHIVDHYTYVIAGDGCLMEGISQEAISFAGHLQLKNLIVFFDDNRISIDGPTTLSTSEDQVARFRAANWHVQSIDGHNTQDIHKAIQCAKESSQPSLIACRTIIAYGAPTKSGTASAHGAPLGQEEIQKTRISLNWPYPPFEIPADILNLWRQTSLKGRLSYKKWQENLEKEDALKKSKFHHQVIEQSLSKEWEESLNTLKQTFNLQQPILATRQASGQVLEAIVPHLPELIGGSADLAESNNAHIKSHQRITANHFCGNYIHYGVREHAMIAIMNGMTAHGGLWCYGGTFLVFSDYCRPAIRLAALMQLPIIILLTHDSIGLGEDGPTHQPIEHLASLRAIPNLNVFRPADPIETIECWQLALQSTETPSILALSRQKVNYGRSSYQVRNLCEMGGYITRESPLQNRHVTLLATGSEVGLALEVAQSLEADYIGTCVVSMPCWRLFDQQNDAYKKSIIDQESLKVSIEAASTFGWDRYVGTDGLKIGVDHFGASAPAAELYAHFGLTVSTITKKIKEKLNSYKNIQ